MTFKRTDSQNWKRKEYFDQFYRHVPTTFSITVNIDISNLKNKQAGLFPTLLFLLSKQVNKHDEFKTSLDEDGCPGIFDVIHPSYTVFHDENETFSNIWTEYTPHFQDFLENYRRDAQMYGHIQKYNAKENCPPNVFYVSLLRWINFSSFNLNLQDGYRCLTPVFTLGKYIEENQRTLMPLSLLVHHAVCDGWHAAKLINGLQDEINSF